MKGVEFAEIRDAIVGAFGAEEFDMLLWERLDYDRQAKVGAGPFQIVVKNVLMDFMRNGTDAILIAEVAAARPLKLEIQEIYQKAKSGKVEIAVEMHKTFYGTNEFTIKDCDGYLVSFAEDVSE